MDVSHGRSARMSFDTAREMAKTLTPAQEIAHIENELRALGYTKTHQPVKEALTMKNPQYNPSTKTLEELRLQLADRHGRPAQVDGGSTTSRRRSRKMAKYI